MTYDPTKQIPTDLSEITKACEKLVACKKKAQELEALFEAQKALIRTAEDELIPEMMNEVGITSVTLSDGTKIELKDLVFAKIKDQEEAFNWLKENESDGIIKYGVSAQLERGDKKTANKVVQSLLKLGVPCEIKESIHHQTLQAFAREAMADEKLSAEIPKEAFGIYETQRVFIK